MENFQDISLEAIQLVKEELEKELPNIDNQIIITFYYLKLHIRENELSNESIFLLNQMKLLLNKKYNNEILTNTKFLLLLYLVNFLLNKENINSEFYLMYLGYSNYKDIFENIEIFKMVFPQKCFSKFIEGLFLSLEHIDFWDLKEIEKKDIIFKLFYLPLFIFERDIEPFKLLFSYLYKYFEQAYSFKDTETLFALYIPLQFSWNSVSSTQEEFLFFNEKVEQKLESYVKNELIKELNIKPIDRKLNSTKKIIKIAFLQERLINYSIYKVFSSLLSSFSAYKNSKFEIIVMDLNFPHFGGSSSFLQNEIKNKGFQYIDCHEKIFNDKNIFFSYMKKCVEVRNLIIENDVDILVGMHSQPEYNFLFSTRTAPLQIYWSHGNYAYDLSEIDFKIKHGDIRVNKEIHCDYDYYQFPDILEEHQLFTKINNELIIQEKNKYTLNNLILGTIGRLSKIDNEKYISLVCRIMEKNPNTIYIACGSGNSEEIIKKVKKYGNIDKWYFVGHVNSHLYARVIDICLNSFPHNQGCSALEFNAVGKFTIQMKTEHVSPLDALPTKLECLFAQNNYDIEKLTKSRKEESIEFLKEYLKEYDFKKNWDELIIPTLLFQYSNDEESYFAKADYLIKNFHTGEIKNNFLIEHAKYRWMNKKVASENFFKLIYMFIKKGNK